MTAIPCAALICNRRLPSLELLALAQAMRSDGRVRPVVIARDALAWHALPEALRVGLDVQMFSLAPQSMKALWRLPVPLSARLAALWREGMRRLMNQGDPFRSSPWGWCVLAVTTWLTLRVQRRRARILLESLAPMAVVLCDDRSERMEPAIIAAARDLSVTTMLLPYAMSSPDSEINSRSGKASQRVDLPPLAFFKRWLARRYPSHVRTAAVGRLLYHHPAVMIGLAWAGMMPPLTWSAGGSSVDIVGVFDEAEKEQFAAQGIAAERLKIVGQVSLDCLVASRERKQGLMDELSIPEDRPVIVCAVPQFAEHKMMDWDAHRLEIEYIFDAISLSGAVGVLSLHPKSDHDWYRPLAEARALIISPYPLVKILGLADIFMAVRSSSTVRWGVMLAIPTVVLDYHGFETAMYEDVAGLDMITERNDLPVLLSRLSGDPAARAERRDVMRRAARDHNPGDGKAGQRVINLLLERHEP